LHDLQEDIFQISKANLQVFDLHAGGTQRGRPAAPRSDLPDLFAGL